MPSSPNDKRVERTSLLPKPNIQTGNGVTKKSVNYNSNGNSSDKPSINEDNQVKDDSNSTLVTAFLFMVRIKLLCLL